MTSTQTVKFEHCDAAVQATETLHECTFEKLKFSIEYIMCPKSKWETIEGQYAKGISCANPAKSYKIKKFTQYKERDITDRRLKKILPSPHLRCIEPVEYKKKGNEDKLEETKTKRELSSEEGMQTRTRKLPKIIHSVKVSIPLERIYLPTKKVELAKRSLEVIEGEIQKINNDLQMNKAMAQELKDDMGNMDEKLGAWSIQTEETMPMPTDAAERIEVSTPDEWSLDDILLLTDDSVKSWMPMGC